uniref:Uncharacterized protein n=1 Tax=Solanum lycopersicum TaxID=4081 RepID=A0A3Q7EAS9_SOLLC
MQAWFATLVLPLCDLNWGCVLLDIGDTFLCNFEAKLGTLFLPLSILNWDDIFLDIGDTFLCNFEVKLGTLFLPLSILNWDCVFLDISGPFFLLFFSAAKLGTLVLPLCELNRGCVFLGIGDFFLGKFETKLGTLFLPCVLNWGIAQNYNLVPSISLPVWMCNEVEAFHQLNNRSLSSDL